MATGRGRTGRHHILLDVEALQMDGQLRRAEAGIAPLGRHDDDGSVDRKRERVVERPVPPGWPRAVDRNVDASAGWQGVDRTGDEVADVSDRPAARAARGVAAGCI